VPMADAAEGFSTLFNRAGSLLRMTGDWLVAADQPSSGYGDARVGGKGSLTDGRRDRQSGRQNHRKRGELRAMMRARKSM
jgi:hypothetical protein